MTEINKREDVKKHLEGEIGKLESDLMAYKGSDAIKQQVEGFGGVLLKELYPKPITDDYERVRDGFGRNKRTYVKVPEEDFEILNKRNSLSEQGVKDLIVDKVLQPLGEAISKLPITQKLLRVIRKLREEAKRRDKYIDEQDKKIAALSKENSDLKFNALVSKQLENRMGISPKQLEQAKKECAQKIAHEMAQQEESEADRILG